MHIKCVLFHGVLNVTFPNTFFIVLSQTPPAFSKLSLVDYKSGDLRITLVKDTITLLVV